METEIYAELKGEGKLQPVFEGLQVKAELRETLAITTITQSYRNAGSKNIEAVYTFPLPLDAVLLEMIVTLGEKTLKGTVLPKQEAEEKYEEAITDGDAPVMLQNPQPGVYTMNVGNLLPTERAQITISYGMFARWQGDSLRYHLPTTIAPRYGSAEQAGLEAQQEPETSLMVDNLFTFEMRITGEIAGRVIESPSHEIAIERASEGKESVITLVRKSAFMDRDLIITVKKSEQMSASAVVEQDGDEYILWGSFQPQFDLAEKNVPRSVKIVVDCSGSMSGDSIAQAREALLRVLDELKPQDWFNIVAFGNSATPLFNAQTKADKESLSYARGFLKKLDADMGGTEIGSALEMAVRLRCPEKIPQDILLITDGEIWEWEKVVAKAVKSQHRFFTVGVGSSVSEAFVRTLGVCRTFRLL
jgi:Ca-activated chloride channel family protein